ncbi:MAG: transposase [Permianibacter sp.]
MGDQKSELAAAIEDALSVDTFGGRIRVRWQTGAPATPFGQLAFFIEFLRTAGLYEDWQVGAPLRYESGNAPAVADVLGTWFLSALAGHRRYAHIGAIRHDGVSPGLLGKSKVISEDALSRALKKMEAGAGARWQQSALLRAVQPLLSRGWVLDVDTTVKPLYGHQEGAVVGFNPHKPDRPSHSYHSYLMAGTRLALDVDVQPGNKTASKYSAPGLHALLARLPAAQWPRLVRGDAGFGNDAMIAGLEEKGLPYLFKLRESGKVKKYIERCLWRRQWSEAGQGWEGVDGELKLMGWKKARRVVLLRRKLQSRVALEKVDATGNLQLAFVDANDPYNRYEYAVLVTDLNHDIAGIAQLYRGRADCENNFDELKNQWGWGGFTTHDLHRCQLSARHVALVYNWWSLFTLRADPKQRREAITSRPLLLHGIGWRTQHAGQTTLTLATTHAEQSDVRGWIG